MALTARPFCTNSLSDSFGLVVEHNGPARGLFWCRPLGSRATLATRKGVTERRVVCVAGTGPKERSSRRPRSLRWACPTSPVVLVSDAHPSTGAKLAAPCYSERGFHIRAIPCDIVRILGAESWPKDTPMPYRPYILHRSAGRSPDAERRFVCAAAAPPGTCRGAVGSMYRLIDGNRRQRGHNLDHAPGP